MQLVLVLTTGLPTTRQEGRFLRVLNGDLWPVLLPARPTHRSPQWVPMPDQLPWQLLRMLHPDQFMLQLLSHAQFLSLHQWCAQYHLLFDLPLVLLFL